MPQGPWERQANSPHTNCVEVHKAGVLQVHYFQRFNPLSCPAHAGADLLTAVLHAAHQLRPSACRQACKKVRKQLCP